MVVFVLAAGFAITGCTKGSGGEGDAVELMWWNAADEQQDVLERIAAAFNEKHTHIKVTVQLQEGDYYAKLQTTLATKSGPDVMWLDATRFQAFQPLGFLLDITDWAARDNFSFDRFVPAIVETYSAGGRHYGIPKDLDSIGLFYNKAMFDAAGLDYPTADWTWEDLREAARKLTIVENGTTVQWGIALYDSTYVVQFPFIIQNGGYILNEEKNATGFGEPEAIEAVQFIRDMITVDNVSPDGAYFVENSPSQLFQSGKVAMIMEGSWMVRPFYNALGDKVDVAPLFRGKQRGFVTHGIGWVANAATKHPEEVWELLKFLGSEEAATIQAETGLVIPAYIGTQEKWVQSVPMRLQELFDQTQYAIPYPTAHTAEWENPMYEHFANIWLGVEAVEEGMKRMQEQADAILRR
jgi:multiple sugar transport system substrate-binding protein